MALFERSERMGLQQVEFGTTVAPGSRRVADQRAGWLEAAELPTSTRSTSPKVVAVTNVRDELDIIEAFVRHTLHFVAQLIVLDNGSTDGTLAILYALRQEGLPLDVVEDPTPGKDQSRRMTRLMREFALERHHADWVLALDADEFVMPADGRPLIPVEARADRPLYLGWRTYVPTTDDDQNEPNPARRLRHRRANETWPYFKVIVPSAAGTLPGAVITEGNHGVVIDGQEVTGVPADAWLAHFPIRTPGQLIAKTVIGHLQTEFVLGRDPVTSSHYRDYFEHLRSDPTGFVHQFATMAAGYATPFVGTVHATIVEDAFPYRGGPLRHTPPLDDAVRTWQPILDYARQMVGELAVVKASLGEDGRLCLEQQARMWSDVRGYLTRQERTLRENQGQMLVSQGQAQSLSERLQTMHAEHQRELADCITNLKRSWTWQAGRCIIGPLRLVVRQSWTRRVVRWAVRPLRFLRHRLWQAKTHLGFDHRTPLVYPFAGVDGSVLVPRVPADPIAERRASLLSAETRQS
jgi:Glycosyl transferase family 2